MTTVLLIDYPPAVRAALRARLSIEPDLLVIGEADDGPEGVRLAQALDPDVVLIDAETPYLDAEAVVRALGQTSRHRGIVVLSQDTSALTDEVKGCRVLTVGKHEGQASLLRAIRSLGRP